MSECSLVEENGRAHFMTKRFDRSGGRKIHMLACKNADVSFEYRCRDHVKDAREDFLMGFEYIKSNLKNL